MAEQQQGDEPWNEQIAVETTKFIEGKRAEFRLYPDLWALELADALTPLFTAARTSALEEAKKMVGQARSGILGLDSFTLAYIISELDGMKEKES